MATDVEHALRLRIGGLLRQRREQLRLTQREAARRCRVSLKHIGEMERGKVNFTADSLERVATGLGWDPVTLFAMTAAPIAEPVRAVLMTHVRAWVGSARRLGRWLKALEPRARLEMDPLLAPRQWLDLAPLRPPRSRKGTGKRTTSRGGWNNSKEST